MKNKNKKQTIITIILTIAFTMLLATYEYLPHRDFVMYNDDTIMCVENKTWGYFKEPNKYCFAVTPLERMFP